MKLGGRHKSGGAKGGRKRRPYDSTLRDAQAAQTRELLVAAAKRRLLEVQPDELSYAALAVEAGVSARTVYRHFPERRDLLKAVAERVLGEIFDGHAPADVTLDDFYRLGTRWFRALDEHPPLVKLHYRAPVYSTGGVGAFKQRVLVPYLEGLDDERRRVVAAIFDLLTSPFAWEVLHDNWGLSGERSMPALKLAIEAFLDAARAHPERLLPEEDP